MSVGGSRLFCGVLRAPNYLNRFYSRTFGAKEETIFRAIDTCRRDVLQNYIEKHPESVGETTTGGTTPLHYLAGQDPWSGIRLPVWREPKREIAQLLIAKGASVQSQNDYQETPLDIAAKVGYAGLTQLFLQHGAKATEETLLNALLRSVNFDPYFRTEEALIKGAGETINVEVSGPMILAKVIDSVAFNLAEAQGRSKVLNPFCTDINRINAEHFRVLDRKIEFLLDQGASADVPIEGMTALQRCFASLDSFETGRLIDRTLRKVAPVIVDRIKNIQALDLQGWTLLHWASYTGMSEIAEYLISKGLDPDAVDPRGLSSRQLAYLNLEGPLVGKERLPNSVREIVQIMKQLPLNVQLSSPCYWLRSNFITLCTTERVFNTGIFRDLSRWRFQPAQLATQLFSLYHQKEGRTPMANAILRKDLDAALLLINNGWNVHTENEFISFKCLDKKLKKKEDLMIGFVEAFSKIEDKEFSKALIQALDASDVSGVTLASEFESACYSNNEEKILFLLESGFTPAKFKALKGREFNDFLWNWYNRYWKNERGWYQKPFFPAACRIIKAIQEKGWIEDNWPHVDQGLSQR